MNQLIKTAALAALAAVSISASAADKVDYTYIAAEGVHEVKHFHGCYDGTDIAKRTKVYVTMAGLRFADVQVETRPHDTGKPSSELVTFRLKNMNASFTAQFRSNDGPHCQQGVQAISFRDTTLNNSAELRSRQ